MHTILYWNSSDLNTTKWLTHYVQLWNETLKIIYGLFYVPKDLHFCISSLKTKVGCTHDWIIIRSFAFCCIILTSNSTVNFALYEMLNFFYDSEKCSHLRSYVSDIMSNVWPLCLLRLLAIFICTVLPSLSWLFLCFRSCVAFVHRFLSIGLSIGCILYGLNDCLSLGSKQSFRFCPLGYCWMNCRYSLIVSTPLSTVDRASNPKAIVIIRLSDCVYEALDPSFPQIMLNSMCGESSPTS